MARSIQSHSNPTEPEVSQAGCGKFVVLVGVLPPTIGGIAVHVERLARLLYRADYQVVVHDIYTERGAEPEYPFEVVRGRGALAVCSFTRLLLFKRPTIIHWHFAGGLTFWATYPVFAFTALFCKQIVTFHTGKFKGEMGRYATIKHKLCRLAFGRISYVIFVNRTVEAALLQSFPFLAMRSSVIMPFIAPAIELPQQPARNRGAKMRIGASGYSIALYEWLTLITACEMAMDCIDSVYLNLYHTYDTEYMAEILSRVAKSLVVFHINRDLMPSEFAAVLAQTDVFVRPTLMDGDSLALREAMQLGIACVASDVTERPTGCHVFPVGNAEALAEIIREISWGKRSGIRLNEDGSRALLNLYEEMAIVQHVGAT